MMHGKEGESVIKTMRSLVGEEDKYRGDIAYTLSMRIVNYCITYAETKPVTREFLDRLLLIIKSEVFTVDTRHQIFKMVFNSNKSKFAPLMSDKEFVSVIA
jgi:hypothetical protein